MPATQARGAAIRALRVQHSREARAQRVAVSSHAAARSKKLGQLRTQLTKKYKGEVFTTIANGARVANINAVKSGWRELDDLITGETDKSAMTVVGSGLGWPRGRIVEIYGEEGMGKALEVSTPVLTPEGFWPIGRLKVGDYVIGSNGRPTRVVGVYPQGVKSGFEVTTTDGGSLVCCAEHLWVTTTDSDSTPRIRTTSEISDTLTHKMGDYEYPRHRLPLVKPVTFDNAPAPLPIDPYLLGCLLGDGNLTGSCVVINKPEPEVLEMCNERLPDEDVGVFFDDGNGPNSAIRIKRKQRDNTLSETAKALRELGLLGLKSVEKFIPNEYLYAKKSDRLRLLRGLLDTDGYVDRRGVDVEHTTSSEQLAAGVIFLARSLGAIVSTTARTPTYMYRGWRRRGRISYRSRIRFVDKTCPVSSEKHLAKWRGGDQTPRYRCIKSIEPVGEAEFICIKVEAKDGLFVADDFIVTHNTTLALHAIAAFQRAGELCGFVDAEHALDVTYAAKLGVNLSDLVLNQPDHGGEQALDIVTTMCDSGLFGCIVVDSVAALTPLAELELDFEESSQPGGHARLMSRALRKLVSVVKRHNTLLIFINQTRLKIGVRFGNPKTTTGGQALKFYASVRMEMVNVKTKKKGDRVLYRRTRIRTVKNKCAPPFRDVFADLAPNKGIVAVHGESEFGGGSEDD